MNTNKKKKQIPLSNEMFATVDADTFDFLNQWAWYSTQGKSGIYYAIRLDKSNGSITTVRMHRLIMNAPRNVLVDHIDGNGLNNTRENLRLCTQSQNQMNRGKNKRSTSGYKGVSWAKHANKWNAQIVVNYKRINLGYFSDPVDAAIAYDNAAMKYHGEFASTNFDGNGVRG